MYNYNKFQQGYEMIRKFEINNFKSLVNFSLPISPRSSGQFVCLVGLNNSGKSTVIQAIDFLAHVGNGNIIEWLMSHACKAEDITSKFMKKKLIDFNIEFEFDNLGKIIWSGSFNSILKRCTSESISLNNNSVLLLKDNTLFVEILKSGKTQQIELKNINYQGSTLSLLNSGKCHVAIETLREYLNNTKSLNILSPSILRQKFSNSNSIGCTEKKTETVNCAARVLS